jgi:hypothetical protein
LQLQRDKCATGLPKRLSVATLIRSINITKTSSATKQKPKELGALNPKTPVRSYKAFIPL